MSGSSIPITPASSAVITGNTVLPPPRLTGQPGPDALMMQRWLAILYDQMILVTNVIGQVTTGETNITTLQGQVSALQEQVVKINHLVGL